jgi:hypothetical protein
VAYFDQQCQLSPLYNTQCPGYQQAYFGQQCNLNQLWSTECPGYQTAYLSQQCGINPLFSTQCPTYQQAYFDQQCQLNTLYNSGCPGYAEAYRARLLADSCRANTQSNPQCPGYSIAAVVPTVTSVSTVGSVSGPVTTQDPVAAVTSVSTMGSVSGSALATTQDPVAAVTEVALVNDPVVNQTLISNTVSPGSAANARESSNNATASLGTGLLIPGFNVAPASMTTPSNNSRSTSSTRQRAVSAARSAESNANSAVRNRQLQQQEDTLAEMATVPGFDAYQNAVIPDAQFYQSRDIYRGVVIRDNARAQRALSQRSDRLHQEMIDEQYRR